MSHSPFPPLRCHMTGGKKSQGSADLPEVRRELPPSGQTCCVAPGDLQGLSGVSLQPCRGRWAGECYMRFLSCAEPPTWQREAAWCGSKSCSGTVGRAVASGSESLCLPLHSFLCGLGQVIQPHRSSVVPSKKYGLTGSPASVERLLGTRHTRS